MEKLWIVWISLCGLFFLFFSVDNIWIVRYTCPAKNFSGLVAQVYLFIF
ncbi:MAG: DUF2768 family protein [Candidatus Magasanikbacteria bacterium]|nr:DUF2768 family protein [Candidatus Magasanikbacteria bacterium]NCS72050.1 DUF2768 family protein [Candidatus Magasanikbacteria bacterium]